MATNLDLDDRLIRLAVKVGGHRSKREAVNAALAEYIRLAQRRAAVLAMGREDPGEVDPVPPRTIFHHKNLRRLPKSRSGTASTLSRARKPA